MEYNYYNQFVNLSNNTTPKVRNGRIWYAAILPYLGLMLESFASNKWIGLALWLAIILLCVFSCARDEKQLRSLGISNLWLYKSRFCPPVYIYRRSDALHQSKSSFVVFIISLIFAITSNGFSVSLQMNDEDFIDSIKQEYTSSIEDLDKNGVNNQIEKRIDEFALEGTVEWSYSADDSYKYVTVSGICNYQSKSNQRFEIIFRLDCDGYTIKEKQIVKAALGGVELKDAEKNEFLQKIFIDKIDSEQKRDKPQNDNYETV